MFRSRFAALALVAIGFTTSACTAVSEAVDHVAFAFASAWRRVVSAFDAVVDWALSLSAPSAPQVRLVAGRAYRLGMQRRERLQLSNGWRMIPSI